MEEYTSEFLTKITNQKILHGNKILNDISDREEKIAAAERRIKELKLLIKHWKKAPP